MPPSGYRYEVYRLGPGSSLIWEKVFTRNGLSGFTVAVDEFIASEPQRPLKDGEILIVKLAPEGGMAVYQINRPPQPSITVNRIIDF